MTLGTNENATIYGGYGGIGIAAWYYFNATSSNRVTVSTCHLQTTLNATVVIFESLGSNCLDLRYDTILS